MNIVIIGYSIIISYNINWIEYKKQEQYLSIQFKLIVKYEKYYELRGSISFLRNKPEEIQHICLKKGYFT